jgi:hemerythrin-like domain-containing protein
MATKTGSKDDLKGSRGAKSGGRESIFNWNSGNNSMVVGAAVAGAALGLAANAGRKLLVQMTSAASGDWFDALKTEHAMALGIFDKIEATDDSQTILRASLLAKLKYALSKHAIQEEMVIYPALRNANETEGADDLTSEHGYVKQYLYELETMANDDPQWLARVRDFRAMIEEHMREEENEIFPAMRARLSDEENSKLTAMMNKEGFKFA